MLWCVILDDKQIGIACVNYAITDNNNIAITDVGSNSSLILDNSSAEIPSFINKPGAKSPYTMVIIVSTIGGLLGLCIAICIMGILLRKKYKNRSQGFYKVRHNSVFGR